MWTIDTLGDGASSVLNDVAIVNDTLIYAVGEIYLKDSTGQIDPLRYNLAIWNGTKWTLQRLPYNYQGQQFVHPIQAVFDKGADDIWFGGNGVIHWNGIQFVEMPIPPGVWGAYRVNKIWGNGQDTYIVGDGGSLAHFNGSTWTKVESGTSVDVQDVWGTTDWVLAAVSYVAQFGEHMILRVGETGVDSIPWGTGRRVHSVWFEDPTLVFTAGGGVHTKMGDDPWKEVTELPLIYTRRVRGDSKNDIVVAGDFGYLAHYNGSTWKYYTGSDLPSLPNGSYSSMSIRQNMIVAVGFDGDRALAIVGLRQ
ncbi:MAG TPA: hypothetical protein VJN65_01970 [Bacteroidota bacterium]|nr:hypothetical protein [Bacteroidota bacterium]